MLIVALVLAVIGLAALVTAVVTSNELIAWVCIGASVIGVLLLIVDALRERSKTTVESDEGDDGEDATTVMPAVADPEAAAEDYPEEPADVPAEPEPSTVGVEARDGGSAETTPDDGPEVKRD
ncbi:hypothetical protein CIW49_29415 [Mycolicibacterium sp. P1-18]|uniref:hypothetical protein n=1 Tax=Mycolicibacterium sp. P1-18 TaxID=2024615 RepID=UPI0011F0A272|nr:hypothetical protein [Mycolicibacterium sp. P1-18]KAA0092359.1 hypothetical protein CIW49_29415 [Mycolicibacterium sp. P1-18]